MLVPGTIVRQIHNIRIDTDEEAIRKKKVWPAWKGDTDGWPAHTCIPINCEEHTISYSTLSITGTLVIHVSWGVKPVMIALLCKPFFLCIHVLFHSVSRAFVSFHVASPLNLQSFIEFGSSTFQSGLKLIWFANRLVIYGRCTGGVSS